MTIFRPPLTLLPGTRVETTRSLDGRIHTGTVLVHCEREPDEGVVDYAMRTGVDNGAADHDWYRVHTCCSSWALLDGGGLRVMT